MSRYNTFKASLYTLIKAVLGASSTLNTGGHKQEQLLISKWLNSNRVIYRLVGFKGKGTNKDFFGGIFMHKALMYANGCLTVNINGVSSYHSAPIWSQKACCLCARMTVRQHNQILWDNIFRTRAAYSKRNYVPFLHSPHNLFIDYCDESRKGLLANTKGRSDAGSLTHQRGQRLRALVTKPWSEPGQQTALWSAGNHVKAISERKCLSFFTKQEEGSVSVWR